nr:GDP-mannose 4,6-dehydratase [Haliscomenobacter sp.]
MQWHLVQPRIAVAGRNLRDPQNHPCRGQNWAGFGRKLWLGKPDAPTRLGHAKDYCEAMWLMLQQPSPEDYVVATGVTTRVREFVRLAFAEIGISLAFQGEGIAETGVVP